MPCDDPFIDGLRRVHGLNGESCILLNRHLVNDLTDYLPQEGHNTVLLIESPHKSEVRKGYPLAGNSGAIFAGAFVGTMGDILHSRRFDDRVISVFKRMGVMNVSRLPLQKNAYRNLENCQENLLCLISHFKKIKDRLDKGRESPADAEETKCAIKDDLKCRIRKLESQKPHAEICYVTCGNIAKYFFDIACPNVPAFFIPHPSSKAHPWFQDGKLNNQVRIISNRFRPFNADPP